MVDFIVFFLFIFFIEQEMQSHIAKCCAEMTDAQKWCNDKWEFYQSDNGEWRWRRIAPNGNNVGKANQGYNSKEMAVKNAIRNGLCERCSIEWADWASECADCCAGLTESEKGDKDTFVCYKDNSGEFRRKRVATNGQNVWMSSEWYNAEVDCCKNAVRHGLTEAHTCTVE